VGGLRRILRTTIDAQLRTKPVEDSVHHHRRIWQAVADHDPERARQAMREHLRYTRQELLSAPTQA